MNDDLHLKTIAELADLIRRGGLSPVDLTDALLARIEALDPKIDAFITVTGDLAREQARRAAQEIAAGRRLGPLHAIPFALKDVYATRGILTSGYSRTRIGNLPAEDAFATARLKTAAAVLLGKLAPHEFAHGGSGLRAGGAGQRHRWIDPHTGRVLRRGRPEACLWPGEPARRAGQFVLARSLRPAPGPPRDPAPARSNPGRGTPGLHRTPPAGRRPGGRWRCGCRHADS